MGLGEERHEAMYMDTFNGLCDAFIKELDSYYVYKLKRIFSCFVPSKHYQIILIEMPKVEFYRESLSAMPKTLSIEIAKILE